MSIYFGDFQPHKVANTGLYIQRKDSTVSLCEDYSANGYDFAQGVAANQSTLDTVTLNFTTNDFMLHSVSNAFGSDTTGSVFISGIVNTVGTAQFYLTSGDTATTGRFISFQIGGTNQLTFQVGNGGTANVIRSNTVLTAGDNFFAEFRQDGTGIRIFLNGVEESLTVVSGSNASNLWWDFATLRDNLVIGALIRSTQIFGNAKINKIHYVSGALSTLDRWKIEQFMSNPLNYI